MKLQITTFITFLLWSTLSSGSCVRAQGTQLLNQPKQMKKTPSSHTEVFTVKAPVGEVFDFIVAEDVLPKILKKYLFIPAVTGTRVHAGDWKTPGSYRTVMFESGDTLREELTHFEKPSYFGYTVSEFSSFQRHFASHGTGQWWFVAKGDLTEVKWTYTFYPKGTFGRMILHPFVKNDFRTYMKRSIQLIQSQIENGN